MNNQEKGRGGEAFAARFLVEQGYEILERNFRCRQGEIDLIARDGNDLVFVEVKFRRGKGQGLPEEAVDFRKQEKIRQAARYYLYRNGYEEDTACRFDVVGILNGQIRLIRNAFS